MVGGKDGDELETVTSKFTIIHYLQSCLLVASGKQLPKWGFEQQEVSCNPNIRDKSGFWNVEDNIYSKRKYRKCNDDDDAASMSTVTENRKQAK